MLRCPFFFGYRMLDTGCLVLAAWYWLLDTGCLILDA